MALEKLLDKENLEKLLALENKHVEAIVDSGR